MTNTRGRKIYTWQVGAHAPGSMKKFAENRGKEKKKKRKGQFFK